ncbi:ribosome biogenesis GTPase YlqF [Virgibacillus halodenitrificans]|jgi:ribosome biogenesis GTPase A|uniref:Ribosome biogenesis GTPase A n=1 Tax=Virgibacillus halodenitrificans TaxID=1482 RepID=A0AAC9IZE4_VIRHA|nr:ribosome biogenesis GTPase YlqF [Virgibacillus halodenitrificans]APC48651.1 ribosome biogenesis GTPase YlqF [Virgibacillus halodenitrificans]MBD1224447.1 ribosome biogenesis GTPase YlqF [Virgibacillus halodenitrificans]MCG1028681.1 ribosome biogenesis GTPase YlqF [Virgibacillus halodenitrificans]MCJ0931225.1 ribosome biogenesis GTPase YlqF [Virgibacillus halodenitrificans]MEC2160280.1 ribosome biogenesis GTPase YlqF [Virgibacillus halodenitrificans]
MTIQWFPGHMAKAKREVEEKLKLVDFVMELVDARAPLSSQNPMLQQVLQNKPKMVVLMKRDLADQKETENWINYFQSQSIPSLAVNVNEKADINKVIQLAKELGKEKMEKLKKKGIQPRPARAMIIGIPNVGKSTLINRLANKKIAKTGDRPGVTKQQLWIKVKKDFELLDTPGILWPKFEDETVGYRLAAIGTIKDQLLSLQDIVVFVIKYMQIHYPGLLEQRYDLAGETTDMLHIFESIGKNRGALESGGNVNLQKVSDLVLRDLRTGRLGRITLESPEDSRELVE